MRKMGSHGILVLIGNQIMNHPRGARRVLVLVKFHIPRKLVQLRECLSNLLFARAVLLQMQRRLELFLTLCFLPRCDECHSEMIVIFRAGFKGRPSPGGPQNRREVCPQKSSPIHSGSLFRAQPAIYTPYFLAFSARSRVSSPRISIKTSFT